MKFPNFLRMHFWLVYLLWIALCGALFVGLRNQGSGLEDRMRSDAAATRALQLLTHHDSRYVGFTAVHTSFARSRLDGSPDRWIVLFDKPQRTGMDEAIVVELTADGATLLRIRRPVM